MSSPATAAEAGVFVVLTVGRVGGGGTAGVLAVLAVGVWRTPVLERPRRGFGMCNSSDSPKTFPESSVMKVFLSNSCQPPVGVLSLVDSSLSLLIKR